MNRYPKRPDGRMSRVHYLFPLAHPGPLIEPGDRMQYRGRSNPRLAYGQYATVVMRPMLGKVEIRLDSGDMLNVEMGALHLLKNHPPLEVP